MNNPFEVLGLKGMATPEEIRTAYRTLARQCHPDMIQDPAEKEAAQTRMVALNLAYEEALRLASPRGSNPVTPVLSSAESILMAQRAMARDNPEGALPIGSSDPKVKEYAIERVRAEGPNYIMNHCKAHFRTTDQVLEACGYTRKDLPPEGQVTNAAREFAG